VHPLKVRAARETGHDTIDHDHEQKDESSEHAGKVAVFARAINAEMRLVETTCLAAASL
jgi:hypothetical protein